MLSNNATIAMPLL